MRRTQPSRPRGGTEFLRAFELYRLRQDRPKLIGSAKSAQGNDTDEFFHPGWTTREIQPTGSAGGHLHLCCSTRRFGSPPAQYPVGAGILPDPVLCRIGGHPAASQQQPRGPAG